MDPSVYSAIIRAAGEQGIDPAFALAVAERESDFNPYSHASRTIYGIYQMSGPLRYQYGSGNSADPYTQASAWGRFINQTRGDLQNRIGREPTNTELYYAHHFGTGRAAAMINGNYPDSMSVWEVFSPYELALNPHLVRAGTVGNVKASIGYDMGRRMQRFGGESGWQPPQFDIGAYGKPLDEATPSSSPSFDIGAYGKPLMEAQPQQAQPAQTPAPGPANAWRAPGASKVDAAGNEIVDRFGGVPAQQPQPSRATAQPLPQENLAPANPQESAPRPGTEVDLSGLTGQFPMGAYESDIRAMQDVGNVGRNADWNKFGNEVRPSENIEDRRDPSGRSALKSTMDLQGDIDPLGMGRAADIEEKFFPNAAPLENVPLPRPRPAGITP